MLTQCFVVVVFVIVFVFLGFFVCTFTQVILKIPFSLGGGWQHKAFLLKHI